MENYEEPPASAESVPDPVGLDESAPSGEEMAERFRAAESAPSGEEMAERFRAAASQEEAFRDGCEQIRSQDLGPFEGDAAPKDGDLFEGEDDDPPEKPQRKQPGGRKEKEPPKGANIGYAMTLEHPKRNLGK